MEPWYLEIRCVHWDIHEYTIVSADIRHRGGKHNLVSSHLTQSVTLGTDWLGFDKLMGQAAGVRSQKTGSCDICMVLSRNARLSDSADGEGEPAEPLSTKDFPTSVNRDLNVVEEFQWLSDPGSYVVPGIRPW